MQFSFALVFVTGLSVSVAGIAHADECTDLGIAVGREVVKTYGNLNKMSVTTFEFCKSDYSKSSTEEQKSIEASYKVLTGKVAVSKNDIQEKQSQECKGSFGLDLLSQQTSGESHTWSVHAKDVMQACFDNEAVRVASAKYAGRTVEFSVRNKTAQRVALRGHVVNPKDMAICDITNQGSGTLGGAYIDAHKAVTVTCTLKGRHEPGTDKAQTTYGGGFITLDVPGSTLRGLPVPEMRDPVVSETLRAVTVELGAAKSEAKVLRDELAGTVLKLKAAEELTAKLRTAMEESQNSAIQRLHVVTIGWPPPVPNSPRFHRLEDNGVACVGNWGPAAVEFADRVCGKGNFAWDGLTRVHGIGNCGLNVNAFICKTPVP